MDLIIAACAYLIVSYLLGAYMVYRLATRKGKKNLLTFHRFTTSPAQHQNHPSSARI